MFKTPFGIINSSPTANLAGSFAHAICLTPVLINGESHSHSQSHDPFGQCHGLIRGAGQKDRSSGNKNREERTENGVVREY